jgi:hypothetical protein
MTDHAHPQTAGMIAKQSFTSRPSVPLLRVKKIYRSRRHKSLEKQVSFLLYFHLLTQ